MQGALTKATIMTTLWCWTMVSWISHQSLHFSSLFCDCPYIVVDAMSRESGRWCLWFKFFGDGEQRRWCWTYTRLHFPLKCISSIQDTLDFVMEMMTTALAAGRASAFEVFDIQDKLFCWAFEESSCSVVTQGVVNCL